MKKLKFEQFEKITILNRPTHVGAFEKFNTVLRQDQDCILAFIKDLAEMKALVFRVDKEMLLTSNGYLYFAYPKLQNKRGLKGIHRDAIFPYLDVDPEGDGFVPGTNLKFNRMVSLDENHTIVGLKYFVNKPRSSAGPFKRWKRPFMTF